MGGDRAVIRRPLHSSGGNPGPLALLSGWSGIDLLRYGLDEPIRHVTGNAMQSLIEAITNYSPERAWTVRDLAHLGQAGGRGACLVGSPGAVASELQRWVEGADLDGFNLARLVFPKGLEAVVDRLVPELQSRCVFKTEYAPGPLRLKPFGAPRLPNRHQAARHRGFGTDR